MRPDFSGEWILDRALSTLSAQASAFERGVMRIDHRDPVFRFEISMRVGDQPPVEHKGETHTDGREAIGGGVLVRLCWDGDALVMTCGPESRDGSWSMSFRYELLEEGRRLRWSEQIRGGGGDQDSIWMFDRG